MILALFVASILGNIIEKHSLMISNFLLFSIKDIKKQSTNVARIMGRTNFLYKNTKKILEFREHFQRKTSFVFKNYKIARLLSIIGIAIAFYEMGQFYKILHLRFWKAIKIVGNVFIRIWVHTQGLAKLIKKHICLTGWIWFSKLLKSQKSFIKYTFYSSHVILCHLCQCNAKGKNQLSFARIYKLVVNTYKLAGPSKYLQI